MQAKVEPYSFSAQFEGVVVTLACCHPRFYGRVGHALVPEAMPTAAARLALEAVRAIAKDLGHGPDSTLLVVQRLRRWQHEGKVAHEQVVEVADMFDAAEDGGLPADDAVALEVAPILKRRLQQDAVKQGMAEYSKKGDFAEVVNLIHRADRLGTVDVSVGTRLGGGFAVIEGQRHLERLPLGVMELDALLGGGVARKQLMMYVGGPGDGKSMGLSHATAHAVVNGLFVGYATLELPDAEVLARIIACLTGVTIDSIKEGSDDAKAKMAGLKLGPCIVKSFTPQATTVQDIKSWVLECEEIEGRKMDLLVVDYADKLGTAFKGKESGQYLAMMEVYESLRILAVDGDRWCFTASQATKPNKDQKKRTDLEHVADSMHKVRVADLVITLNARDDGEQMEWYVAKHRTGKSRFKVGPLPTDFSCGCIAPVVREDPNSAATDAVAELLGGGAP